MSLILCRKCKNEKTIDNFRILKHGTPNSYCKQCHNEINIIAYRKARGLDTNLEVKYKSNGGRKVYHCDLCNNDHKSEKLRQIHYETYKHKKKAKELENI